MKKIALSLLLVTLSSFVAAAGPAASNDLKNTKKSGTQPSLLKSLLFYTPPAQAHIKNQNISSINVKKRLDGGGTREVNSDTFPFQFLAPNHTALTSQAQPVIYWYASSGGIKNITLTLLQDSNDKPLIEKTIAVNSKGLQQIELTHLGISLQPDVEYRVSLDGLSDSGDHFSSVTLRYQPFKHPLTSLEDKAQAGYWYDILQQLVVNHSPETNELLQQIGINISIL